MKSRSEIRRLIGLSLLVASLLAAPTARAQEGGTADDPGLAALRDRFREGLEKYRAGAFAEAILIWEKVYRELGPERGFRLTFDLARAYEEFGDPARAAEAYELYLDGIARRRSALGPLDPSVEKQEPLARARLAELSATQGRIRIGGDVLALVKIDHSDERRVPSSGLTAYVVPDKVHVVTFDPGTKDERHLEVAVGRGDVVVVRPPPLPPKGDTTAATTPSRPAHLERVRPYDERVLWVGAGLTVLSAAIPIAFYARAGSVHDDYDGAASDAARARTNRDAAGYAAASTSGSQLYGDYDAARNTALASLAIPIVLAATTVGLTAYWLLAPKERRVGRGNTSFAAIGAGKFVF